MNGKPQRIVSVVPSQTELLYDLGLDDRVVGITKFCVHPKDWFQGKVRVGGTKKLHIDKIIELQPDLIIANKEENEKSQIEELQRYFPVWVSDISTLEEALKMIVAVGEITGAGDKASTIIDKISTGFLQLRPINPKLKAVYLIWRDPYMTIGEDTFIHEMLDRCGFQNCFAKQERYPSIDLEDIKAAHPDIILLSSEPYPFKEKHVAELQKFLPETKVVLVDGEMFSWYGSRLMKAPGYFHQLLVRSGKWG